MRGRPRGAILVAGLAVGCDHGNVGVEGIDRFGSVRSASWIELSVGGQALHEFVATDVPDLCGMAEDVASGLARLQRDHLQALDDANGDVGRSCDADQSFYDAAHELTRVLLRRKGSYATIVFDDREGDPEDPPNDGMYQYGDVDDPTFAAWVTEIADNPFRVAFDRQCAESTWENARIATLGTFPVESGTADAKVRGAEAYRITVDAMLADPDGGTQGPLDVTGRFERCAFEVDPGVVGFLPFLAAPTAPAPADTDGVSTP